MMEDGLFFGKYRGKVAENNDPNKMGRLQVEVPAVLGEGKKSWAMPCLPYAGPKVGFFALPPKGANVWVEFEGGDPDYPIWTGCFWGKGEMPVTVGEDKVKAFLKTEGTSLTIIDKKNSGGLFLEVGSPAVGKPIKVTLNNKGVAITNQTGSFKLSPTEINLDLKSARIDLKKSSLELNVNPKGNIKVTGIKVNVNKNALEVM